MTERINLTEEMLDLIFDGFDNDLGNNIGVYNTSKEEKIRDVEDEIKQQILEDQTKAICFDTLYDLPNARQNKETLEKIKKLNFDNLLDNIECEWGENSNFAKELKKLKEILRENN